MSGDDNFVDRSGGVWGRGLRLRTHGYEDQGKRAGTSQNIFDGHDKKIPKAFLVAQVLSRVFETCKR
ncbi:MAG: hypothetical protein Q7T84_12955 [Phenylobacterium sp.]|uniref:hypothetical protein n=1 Tax=Phenylobacterium sp. TaxID=1871053 RepID=UPI002719B8A7|nr:hypothetical protein [Phenylobacterium sp.]MDO9432201.1 hypothetical protein [Phenylobacterium sp.]